MPEVYVGRFRVGTGTVLIGLLLCVVLLAVFLVTLSMVFPIGG